MKRICAFFFVICYCLSVASAQRASEPANPYQGTLDRLESLTKLPEAQWRFHADVPHPEDPALDDAGWATMKVGDTWTNGARVLRRWIEIPAKINGYDLRGARVKLDLRLQSDGPMTLTVFSNGSIVYHGTEEMQQPMALTEKAQPGQRYLIAVRADATTAPTRLARSELTVEPAAGRPDPSLLRLEILSAQPLIAAYSESKAEHEQQLAAAVKAIDFAPLEQGDQAAFDASLRQAQSRLEGLRPWLQNFTIRAVGNSHIDMAWLWPWAETVEVVRNTFQSALDLMREYPEFKFTMSSARAYQWMQEKYPDLFQQIEQRVKEGRWEIIGGMWVEPDLNMPAGESLVRQILVGNRYFLKNFGVETNIGWNPDSFGYNWQLPQIYKKAGMDYFVTQKLLWAHDYTTFPYKLFWWEAPDGSKLLTYFPHDYAGGIDADKMAQDLSVWMPSIYGPKVTDPPEEMMHLYGVGDHGGGPTRTMLDSAEQLMKPGVVYPHLEFSTAKDFFAGLEKKLPTMKVPTWDGELYFQYHRGVFTTQAETKRRIRQSEEAMLDAEKFASLAMLEGRPYPLPEMERAWKRLLFDHFHDIMPGSGIAVNYLDAARNLRDVRRAAGEVTQGSLREIAAHINTEGPGVPVMIFNPLNWTRTEVREIEA
ncbi:MAG TPA: alpha-mannosidase, partial [Terriglobales bacterium]